MPPRLAKKTVTLPRDYYIALEDAATYASELLNSGLSAETVEELEAVITKLDEMSPDTEETYPYAADEEEEEGAS